MSQPELVFQPDQSNEYDLLLAKAMNYALNGGSISLDGIMTMAEAQEQLAAGCLHLVSDTFRAQLLSDVNLLESKTFDSPIEGGTPELSTEMNRQRQETARNLAGWIKQAGEQAQY